MTNISKINTHSKDYKLVHKELLSLISKLNNNSAIYFTDELLTESERIMLVKRFGAIFMYNLNYTPYRVSETLGISIPTASRLFRHYSSGNFTRLLNGVKKAETNRFLQLIEGLIMAQASPQARARLINHNLK